MTPSRSGADCCPAANPGAWPEDGPAFTEPQPGALVDPWSGQLSVVPAPDTVGAGAGVVGAGVVGAGAVVAGGAAVGEADPVFAADGLVADPVGWVFASVGVDTITGELPNVEAVAAGVGTPLPAGAATPQPAAIPTTTRDAKALITIPQGRASGRGRRMALVDTRKGPNRMPTPIFRPPSIVPGRD